MQLSPQWFTRACLCLAALTFLGIYPGLIWVDQKALPKDMRPVPLPVDFMQYYSGAVVVRQAIWDALYPIPKSEVYSKPSSFAPVYKTFLYNPADNKLPAFYLPLGVPAVSDCSPKLLAYFPEANTGFRVIYPPPTALLVSPLALVSYDWAAHRVWPTLCFWSYFVVAFFSSRSYRLLRGGASYTEGFIVLACLILTFRGPIQAVSGNVSPILSALVACSYYCLMTGRCLPFSLMLIPLILFKTIGLNWIPLLLVNRAFWRTILYLAIIAILLNGLTIGLAGISTYETFFSLAPKILVPIGEGLVPYLLRYFGFYPHTLYFFANLLLSVLIYYGYWKKHRPTFGTRLSGPSWLPLGAALAGMTSLFCLLNFSVWYEYTANYVALPFLGWILMEGFVARGPWRIFVFGGTIGSLILLSSSWIVIGSLFHLFGAKSVTLYSTLIYPAASIILVPAFFLIVALRRLLKKETEINQSPLALNRGS